MIAQMRNPFLSHKLDDTVTLPAGNVPELHATALDQCGSLLDAARQGRQAVGLLVVGEAGSGKSHLIAQLRQQLAAIPSAVLVSVPLKGAFAGRLWRHLRKRLVTELLRPYPNPTHGANGILRLLRNRFPGWAAGIQTPTGGLMDWLLGRSSAKGNLQPFLDEFSRTCEFDYQFRKVLPKVGSADLNALAHSWLAGEQLGTEDLEKLGLPPTHPSEQEQEVIAREVVLSFLRLAGDRTVLFFCLDEVEAIQSGAFDAPVLRQFTTLATDLVSESGPRVVATFIRPQLQLEISKAVETSNIQKIAQFMTTVPPLTWEQSVRVVVSRLEGEPTCQVARPSHPGEPFWPIGREFVERTFQANKRNITPRHIILACAVEFDRLKKGRPPEVGTPPAGQSPGEPEPGEGRATPNSNDEFYRLWERQRKRLLERLQGIQLDTVMGIGLPWLAEVTGAPLVRVHDIDKRLGDINLLFQPTARGRKPIGVSFCNQEPRSLWRRLDRVLKQWNENRNGAIDSLVGIRFDPWPETEAINTRLKALRTAGVSLFLIDRQQLAELASFQSMLTAAVSGELTRGGKPVEAAEYNEWVGSNLSDAVKELAHQIFNGTSSPPPGPPPSPGGKKPAAKTMKARK